MKIIVRIRIQWLALIFIAGAFFSGQAQPDSLSLARLDSVLADQQEQADRLLYEMDSLRLSYRLEQYALQQQLEYLDAGDEPQRAIIRSRLDSLKASLEVRQARITREMNSLRAATQGAPVIFFSDTLFYIFANLEPFSPSTRATAVSRRLEFLVENNLYAPESLKIYEGEDSHFLLHGEEVILSVTSRDAFWLDKSREEVAEQYLTAIKQSLTGFREHKKILQTLLRIGLLLVVLVIFFYGIRYLNRGISWLNVRLLKFGKERFIRDLSFRNYRFLSAEQGENFFKKSLVILKWVIIAIVVYLALPVVFSIFPATMPIATTLLNLVLDPLKEFFTAIIGYIPELFTIIIILGITHYFLVFLRFITREIESGHLHLPGFYPDWAAPTFNIAKIIIIAFAFIVIFPYLPGSDSPAFRGVSVFLGILISLGSSSAISNIIAGLVIIYMRAFKVGDRVKIGDTTGDVIEKTMLVTRLRTIKNEDVTIPNSSILSGTTVNYSSSAENLGLILNSTVTIGYDVPWRQVHELLINAALKTDHIRKQPPPFVLQTSLDDFYVSYQINAYTDQPSQAAKIYSHLHCNIQDAFNEAGVEILSPHYRAARDGNMVTIPANYLPADYKPPTFNLKLEKEDGPEGK